MSDRLYRKRGSKVYYGWYYHRRQRRNVCTFQTDRKLALKELRRLADEAHGEAGQAAAAPPHSVTQALAHWFAEGMVSLAEDTVDYYRQKSGHLIRELGAFDVNGLEPAHVTKYIDTRRGDGTSWHTISKEMTTLRRCLRHAHARGDLKRDPRPLIPEMKSGYVPRKRFLTDDEFVRLVDSFKRQHRRDWIWVAVYTGGRDSEVGRLAWTDVDLEAGWLELPGTKTGKARRMIPIHPELRAALAGMKERKDTHRKMKNRKPGLVVGPWSGVVEDLKKKCLKLGIAKCSPNDLRRTFASWLVQKKTPLKVVATLLGHTSTVMVDRVYGHLETSQLQDAVRKLPHHGPRVLPRKKA